MINDIYDMDTHKKVRCVSDSFSESTASGYSTVSSGHGVADSRPTSVTSIFSLPPSPAVSPATALQNEFSSLLVLPSNFLQQQQQQLQLSQEHITKCAASQNASSPFSSVNYSYNTMNYSHAVTNHNPVVGSFSSVMLNSDPASPISSLNETVHASNSINLKSEYSAKLRILEQPTDKFRFRYKSEMHGTHGSLHGVNSKRTPKTFPEVQLEGFAGNAMILCSVFQNDIESPHSHQLIVRKDDIDICDPHQLHVSPEKGYVAQFQNMGIIHTAKKFIYDELLKKKRNRLIFKLGRSELSTREEQLLHKETEKEAKTMNLNQVRLCFEAFKIEDDKSWTRIADPVYTHTINNRKSAQTGELRICRLSIATGSVVGGDDLILLVEKVSKKNIKVRFYEINDDEEIIWEAFGKFRQSDVHHQYAIVCTTPPYNNKDIDKPVDVFIELLRPSDDERSYPPVSFRYKPRNAVVSRKRRRTCSSTTLSGSGNSNSNSSSVELPKPVQEQTIGMHPPISFQNTHRENTRPTISEEYNKDWLLNSEEFRKIIYHDSDELLSICPVEAMEDLMLEHDGVSSNSSAAAGTVLLDKRMSDEKKRKLLLQTLSKTPNKYLEMFVSIYQEAVSLKTNDKEALGDYAKRITDVFLDYRDKNDDFDSIMHEIIMMDKVNDGIKICEILKYFNLGHILNKSVNSNGESCLHIACLHHKPHFIRPLLMLGCDPNLQDRSGNTALHIAVQEQSKLCINSFLNYMMLPKMEQIHSINLKLTNDAGLSIIHLAVRNNSLDLIQKFLQYDKDAALVRNTMDGNNVLHTAVLHKNVELVKLLLKLQIVNLECQNSAGRTAIELTKTLDAESRKVILDLLEHENTSDIDVTESSLLIKEEDITSSSSNTEDEDEEVNTEQTDMDTELSNIKVEEEEFQSDGEGEICCNDNGKLHNLLEDPYKMELLTRRIDCQGRWRKLAKLLKMQHLLCLWSNASTMLSYVRANVGSIGYEAFIDALQQVDEETALSISNGSSQCAK